MADFLGEALTLGVKMVALYVPPIIWKGDPKGHIGVNDAFFFVVSGECYLHLDDKCYIIKAGQLAFLPKGVMRTYSAIPKSLIMYEFDFDATLGGVNWYERLGRKARHPVVDVPDKERMSALFETSLRHEMGKDPTFELIARTNLAEIIGTFASLSFEREEKEAPFKEVTDYMEAHLEGQVKVDTLAELACMQTTYFIKKFGEAFGTSPINYLNKLRIYRAMTRLASTDDTIDNISKSCGFFDNSYFSRVFRGFAGTTPREYRDIFK